MIIVSCGKKIVALLEQLLIRIVRKKVGHQRGCVTGQVKKTTEYSNTPSCEEVFHHPQRSRRKCVKEGLSKALVKISVI